MITFSAGISIAKELGIRFEKPYWAEDLNAHTFHEDRMTDDFCWIQHTFYLADSVDDCIARQLAAIEVGRAEVAR